MMMWIYPRTDADLPQNEATPIHQLSQSERSGGWCPAKRPFFGSETDTRAAKRAQADTEAAQRAMPDQVRHDGNAASDAGSGPA